ncbi:CRISPR-associated protein Cmr1 [Rhodobium orientis]|uniref:CRISPR type III-associated protein domain-containing protein n=1 Tax=Rhodobium orientis TaxID=34017 RepID=A0A327JN04_9HYPH|nr:RAMP superfamily CRISPR-associated protein [Rhodobium orientis]MBB4302845.1 CRISPR-associated protein Cmr1 [Rhodobium orientis]RAI26252.1 hypothetical protein CH339_14795 [Rhodobium orientis]
MKVITGTFEIVTPMFLGGADHQATTLRASSIKAELVFWWRALHAAKIIADAEDETLGNAEEKRRKGLEALHAREVELSGGPGGNVAARQSAVLVRANWEEKPPLFTAGRPIADAFGLKPSGVLSGGVNYLGYGLISLNGNIQSASDDGKVPAKSCFGARGRFVVEFACRRLTDQQICEFKRTLEIMGLLGGLGSRKRRGWGSLALERIEVETVNGRDRCTPEVIWSAPQTVEAWRGEVRKLVDLKSTQRKADDLPLSAFALGSSVRIWKEGFDTAIEAIDALGHGYHLFRAWGASFNGHMIGGKPAEQNFKAEHDWYVDDGLDYAKRGRHRLPRNQMPPRANLGLPLPYDAKKGKVVDADAPFGRRASPLMFHIAKIGKKYFPVAIHMGNLFLPETETDQAKSVKISICREGDQEFEPNRSVVEGYLTGVTKKQSANHRYFDADPAENFLDEAGS